MEHHEWHTAQAGYAHSADPALELARWLEVPGAVDEPAEWRCVIRLVDGMEVVGEEFVEIGERWRVPVVAPKPPSKPEWPPPDRPRAAILQVDAPDQAVALKKT